MDALQRGTLTLIQAAITGNTFPLPEDFKIEDAMDMIYKHQIVGLAYEGAVKCGIDRSSSAMQQLFQRYYSALLHNEKQMAALRKLEQAFQENSIDFLPLKGTILKPLYPQPAMRTMGDADILIRQEQYDKIKPVMESLGFAEKKESDHELVWTDPALYLELHKRMMPSYTADFFDYFEKGWQRAIREQGCRYTLRPEDHYIYLFVHYAKHYRREGVGIRQPVDLWVYQQAHRNMDFLYIEKELSALNLNVFHQNTRQMLSTWFEDCKEDDRTTLMTNYIWSSGSWGTHQSAQTFRGLKAEQEAGSRLKGKALYILQVIFPSAKKLSERYRILSKAPWLLPILWPVRWIGALLFRHNNIRKYKRIIDNRSADKIDAFSEMLDYVGIKPE